MEDIICSFNVGRFLGQRHNPQRIIKIFPSDELEEDKEPGKAKPRSGSKSLDIGEYIGTRAGGWWALLVPGGTSSLPQKPRRGGTASSCRVGTRYEPHTVEHRVSESHYEPVPKGSVCLPDPPCAHRA